MNTSPAFYIRGANGDGSIIPSLSWLWLYLHNAFDFNAAMVYSTSTGMGSGPYLTDESGNYITDESGNYIVPDV